MFKFLLLSLVFLQLVFPSQIFAQEKVINCENRYLTLINPVRGRDLWADKSLKPIQDQYNLINQRNLKVSWLLQYDVLNDTELKDYIRGFNNNQELGIFLEISKKLADDSRVVYPYDASWFFPNAVFLSGYSIRDRDKLIDTLFDKFRDDFGYYPKSVGAWWIDSYSLNYLKQKYGVTTALIVADQKTTDNYGVWGQWWSVPYYPSKANILTPASSLSNKQDMVILQWAQRDLDKSLGEGPNFSNYSLQANDYKEQGLDTNYFKDLSSVYLDCQNKVGQITVGLETGIESIDYVDEYKNQ